jgi:hypothetical protein
VSHRARDRSNTGLSVGAEQQIRALPATGGSSARSSSAAVRLMPRHRDAAANEAELEPVPDRPGSDGGLPLRQAAAWIAHRHADLTVGVFFVGRLDRIHHEGISAASNR